MTWNSILNSVLGGTAGVLLCALPAAAQIETSPMGTITANIDGSPYSAETLDVPSEGSSTAEARSMGPVTSIMVQGLDPEAESRMVNNLVLEFTLMGTDASAMIMDATVSYWPEGMDAPFFHSENSGTQTEIALAALSLAEGAAATSGTFSALMCRKEDFFSESDPNDCRPVEGAFDTALRIAE